MIESRRTRLHGVPTAKQGRTGAPLLQLAACILIAALPSRMAAQPDATAVLTGMSRLARRWANGSITADCVIDVMNDGDRPYAVRAATLMSHRGVVATTDRLR